MARSAHYSRQAICAPQPQPMVYYASAHIAKRTCMLKLSRSISRNAHNPCGTCLRRRIARLTQMTRPTMGRNPSMRRPPLLRFSETVLGARKSSPTTTSPTFTSCMQFIIPANPNVPGKSAESDRPDEHQPTPQDFDQRTKTPQELAVLQKSFTKKNSPHRKRRSVNWPSSSTTRIRGLEPGSITSAPH